MRKLSVLMAFLLFVSEFAIGQVKQNLNTFTIAVVMPDHSEGLDESQLLKLETKIVRIFESAGVTVTEGYSSFVVYPKFEIYESNSVEGGMQNIVISNVNMTLIIKQLDNNLIFSSVTKTLKGSGNSKTSSLTNAISTINTDDDEFKGFVASGKKKIVKYYNDKCSSIMSNAERLAKQGDYQQAIALSNQIPEGTSCYASAQMKAMDFFLRYQSSICRESVKQANISIASKEYTAALGFLANIDPAGSCAAEAKILINKIEAKVSLQERRDYDLKIKVYNDKLLLNKQRINAIRDIAVSYFSSKPSTNYYYLVR